MTILSARFKQAPLERKRYVLDYSLQLGTGEAIVGLTSQVTQISGAASPAFVIDGTGLLPPVNGVITGCAYFASLGVNAGQYEVRFLATTNIGQVLEDVVQYNVQEKV